MRFSIAIGFVWLSACLASNAFEEKNERLNSALRARAILDEYASASLKPRANSAVTEGKNSTAGTSKQPPSTKPHTPPKPPTKLCNDLLNTMKNGAQENTDTSTKTQPKSVKPSAGEHSSEKTGAKKSQTPTTGLQTRSIGADHLEISRRADTPPVDPKSLGGNTPPVDPKSLGGKLPTTVMVPVPKTVDSCKDLEALIKTELEQVRKKNGGDSKSPKVTNLESEQVQKKNAGATKDPKVTNSKSSKPAPGPTRRNLNHPANAKRSERKVPRLEKIVKRATLGSRAPEGQGAPKVGTDGLDEDIKAKFSQLEKHNKAQDKETKRKPAATINRFKSSPPSGDQGEHKAPQHHEEESKDSETKPHQKTPETKSSKNPSETKPDNKHSDKKSASGSTHETKSSPPAHQDPTTHTSKTP